MISWNSSRRFLEWKLLEILIPSIMVGLPVLEGLFQPKWPCGSTGSTPNTGGIEYCHFCCLTGWCNRSLGQGNVGDRWHQAQPSFFCPWRTPSNTAQIYKITKGPGWVHLWVYRIQDFCHCSSFTTINLQEKYKDLQVFFSFLYKKVQNNSRLKAASPECSKTLQRFPGMKQILTTHSPITPLLNTPRKYPLQILWVDLHICFWFLKGIRIIFVFYSSFKG